MQSNVVFIPIHLVELKLYSLYLSNSQRKKNGFRLPSMANRVRMAECYGTVVPVAPSAVHGMYTCATLCPPSPIVLVCRQRAGGEEGLGRRQPGTSWLNAGDERRYACVDNTKVSRPNRLSVSSLGRGTF